MQRPDAVQRPIFYSARLTDEDILLVFTSREEWLSRRQIAERVWRKVTPGFIDRLERICRENFLQRAEYTLPNGRRIFFYRRVLG